LSARDTERTTANRSQTSAIGRQAKQSNAFLDTNLQVNSESLRGCGLHRIPLHAGNDGG
jgi:hypothetical protein